MAPKHVHRHAGLLRIRFQGGVVDRPLGMIPTRTVGCRLSFVPDGSSGVECGASWESRAGRESTTVLISQGVAEIIDLHDSPSLVPPGLSLDERTLDLALKHDRAAESRERAWAMDEDPGGADALVPRRFRDDRDEADEGSGLAALDLHDDERGGVAGAPETARLRTLAPHITEVVDGHPHRLTGAQCPQVLHETAIDPNVDIGVVDHRRIDEFQVQFARNRLDLHDAVLHKRVGIRACSERGVVESGLASRAEETDRAEPDRRDPEDAFGCPPHGRGV